jgi:hypothetical protein
MAAAGFTLPLALVLAADELPATFFWSFLVAAALLGPEQPNSMLFGAVLRIILTTAPALTAFATRGSIQVYARAPILLLFVVIPAVLVAPGLGLPVLMRTRTASVGHLLLSGVAIAIFPAFVAWNWARVVSDYDVRLPLAGVASTAFAVIGIATGDAVAKPFDRHRPRPRGGGLSSVWALWFGLAVLSVLGSMMLCGLDDAGLHRMGNETLAIGTLKTIGTCQALCRERNGTTYAGSVEELVKLRLLDAHVGSRVHNGYVFRVTRSQRFPGDRWTAVANPKVPGKTGQRYFFTNQDGVVLYAVTGPATPGDDCVPPAGFVPTGK